MLKRFSKGSKGFTLMELMVVVAIIGVLMAIVAPAVTSTKSSSAEGQVKSDGTGTQTAVDNFNNRSIQASRFPEKTPGSSGPGYVAQYDIDTTYAVASTFDDSKVILTWVDRETGDTVSTDTLATTIAVPGTTSTVFKRRFINFGSTVDTYDSNGSVKKAYFVPDFLNKQPASLSLKADETKDLGTDLNNFPEYLWLLLVNAPNSDQESRNVQVYRAVSATFGSSGYGIGKVTTITYSQLY